MPEVEDEAGGVSRLLEDHLHAPFDLVHGREEHDGIQVALHRHAGPQAAPGFIERHPPVHPDHRAACFTHRLQQGRRPRAEMDQRHALVLEPFENEPHVGLHILPVVVGAQAPDPAVEQLDGLRARLDLAFQIGGHHARELVHQPVPDGRLPVHEPLGFDVVPRGAPFNRVAGQRERRAGEADQRHASIEPAAGQRNGVRHIAEFAPVDQLERVHVRARPDGVVDHGSLAFLEREAEAHRLEREQNVGEDNRGIEREAVDRLKRDLRRQLGRLADFEDGMLRADGPVFRHVAAGLPHEPHRHAVRGLAATGFEESIVHRIGILWG